MHASRSRCTVFAARMAPVPPASDTSSLRDRHVCPRGGEARRPPLLPHPPAPHAGQRPYPGQLQRSPPKTPFNGIEGRHQLGLTSSFRPAGTDGGALPWFIEVESRLRHFLRLQVHQHHAGLRVAKPGPVDLGQPAQHGMHKRRGVCPRLHQRRRHAVGVLQWLRVCGWLPSTTSVATDGNTLPDAAAERRLQGCGYR